MPLKRNAIILVQLYTDFTLRLSSPEDVQDHGVIIQQRHDTK